VLQFDSHACPSEAMVRAEHTLCGIHRAGGFPLIATTARALEQAARAAAARSADAATAQPVSRARSPASPTSPHAFVRASGS
jgi:hypothetical protein